MAFTSTVVSLTPNAYTKVVDNRTTCVVSVLPPYALKLAFKSVATGGAAPTNPLQAAVFAQPGAESAQFVVDDPNPLDVYVYAWGNGSAGTANVLVEGS